MSYLVFGATGLVGQSLSKLLSERFKTTIAVRKPTLPINTNITERLVDFENFNSFEKKNYDGVFCCLGTTIRKAGSKKSFQRVDLDYVEMCYKYSINSGAKFFCVISALGAKRNSKIFYNQVKGKMEESLNGNHRVIIVRPSLLMGEREEFRFAEKLALTMSRPFNSILTTLLGKYAPIKAERVAQSMIDLSLKGETDISIEYKIISP